MIPKYRDSALSDISESLNKISTDLENSFSDLTSYRIKGEETELTSSLIVQKSALTVKVEPNPIIRGTVFTPQECTLNKRAQDLFETSVIMQIISFEDLYGGKICASLDRQHPRDLFDIKFLLETRVLLIR